MNSVRGPKGISYRTTKRVLLKLLEAPITFADLLLTLKLEGYKERNLKQSIKRLSEKNLIKINNSEAVEQKIFLNKYGRSKALTISLEDLEIIKPAKWDQMWRLVMFDIPEKQKGARRALKAKLDELGFLSYQKSIYVLPYDCYKEIDYIRNVYNIKKYVKTILAKEIENEAYYIKKFEL